MNLKRFFYFVFVFCVGSVATTWAATREATRHVREGIRQHRAGDYPAAEKAFSQASESSPQDPRIAFNRACALAAQGKTDEAEDLFRTASLARDQPLVAASHYNLGCLESTQAKALFGGAPEEATGETREQGLSLLTKAVAHYRDCLRVSPAHDRARHNLEVLRLWIKNMQDVWAQRDRQRRRDEMDLLQFLEMLTSQQRLLRSTTRILAQENSDLGAAGARSSPRGRQAIAATERQQRELAEEIEPLGQKIEQALQAPPASAAANQPAPAAAPDPELERAREVLTRFALTAKSSMFRAADDLAVRELEQAIEGQSQALEALDDVFRVVAPFQALLQKATSTQQQLLDSTKSLDEADQATSTHAVLASSDRVEDQSHVASWTEALTAKAQHGLSQLKSQPAPPTAGPAGPHQDDPPSGAQSASDLTAAYEKAIELGPGISKLAQHAKEHLDHEQWDQALPDQQEALRLLKEIAKQQPQDQDQDQDQQQEQNEDEQDKTDQEQQQSAQDKQQQQQRLSREQAEALLRKVRQREREHRERQKEQQRYLRGRVGVDKDW